MASELQEPASGVSGGKRTKRKFDYCERYAVWYCHGQRCWQCQEPLRLIDTTIDHVIPESLIDQDERRQAVLTEWGAAFGVRYQQLCKLAPVPFYLQSEEGREAAEVGAGERGRAL